MTAVVIEFRRTLPNLFPFHCLNCGRRNKNNSSGSSQ